MHAMFPCQRKQVCARLESIGRHVLSCARLRAHERLRSGRILLHARGGHRALVDALVKPVLVDCAGALRGEAGIE
jgi:hypothetical protein